MGSMEQKQKRIRRNPARDAEQRRAWKLAHHELVNEQARARRANPEIRARERELERARRAAKRAERPPPVPPTQEELARKDERRRANAAKRQRTWRAANVDQERRADRLRYQKHKAETEVLTERQVFRRAYMKTWKQANHGAVIAAVTGRKAHIKRATPPWAYMNAIAAFYAACPIGYHVDHIDPLRATDSCGLHVLWNLQYLPAVDNLRKKNRRV